MESIGKLIITKDGNWYHKLCRGVGIGDANNPKIKRVGVSIRIKTKYGF